MTTGGGPRYPDVLFAQASPRSVGGVSLFAAPRPVTAATVAGYFSVDQVARRPLPSWRRPASPSSSSPRSP